MLDAKHAAKHSEHDSQNDFFVLLRHLLLLEENAAGAADGHVVRPRRLWDVQFRTDAACEVIVGLIDKDVKRDEVRICVGRLELLHEFEL